MELLIIKSNDGYIRVKDGVYLRCGIDKASVFSVEKAEKVKAHALALQARGFPNIAIRKLVLSEEPWGGDGNENGTDNA